MTKNVIFLPRQRVSVRQKKRTKKKIDVNAAVYRIVRPSIDIMLADGDNDNKQRHGKS